MTQFAVRYTNKSGATQIQPYYNSNGVFTALGTAWTPTGGVVPDDPANNKSNLCVKFGSYFYCVGGTEVRRYNPSTGAWDADLSRASAVSRSCGGLYVGLNASGTLRLFTMHRNSSTGTLDVYTLDTPGGSWNAVINGPVSFDPDEPHGFDFGIMFEGLLITSHDRTLITFDPALETYSQAAFTFTTGPFGVQPVRAGARMFALLVSVANNRIPGLLEWIGGAWTLAVASNVFPSTAAPLVDTDTDGTPLIPEVTPWTGMHYDEASDSLIVHCWQPATTVDPGTGWKVMQVPVSTLVGTAIHGTVIDAALRYPTGPTPQPGVGGKATRDSRFLFEVDTSDPTAPVTYIWTIRSDGVWARYQWNGVSSLAGVGGVANGSGGDRGIALSNNPSGGGQYDGVPSTTASPSYYLEEVQAREPIVGGTKVFLRGYLLDDTGGSPTPTDETVGLYYGTSEKTAKNLATIQNAVLESGPGSAPSITANKITSFTFDNTSIYSVEWLAETLDGISDGEQHLLEPNAET